MHSLEIIIERNAKAAGRELGHAIMDGDAATVAGIHAADVEAFKGDLKRLGWLFEAREIDNARVAGLDAGWQEG